MSITSGIVLYVVIWALIFFMFLPQWQVSQSESGEIVPGTPGSAPVDMKLKKKALWTTLCATVVFALVFCAIQFEWISLSWFTWATPPSAR